jgi:hypothetical protein
MECPGQLLGPAQPDTVLLIDVRARTRTLAERKRMEAKTDTTSSILDVLRRVQAVIARARAGAASGHVPDDHSVNSEHTAPLAPHNERCRAEAWKHDKFGDDHYLDPARS